jgi:hypothetical protein
MESILKPRPIAHSVHANVPGSKASRRVGAVMSGIAMLFLLVDSLGKLIPIPSVVDWTVQLGYPESTVRPIGIILFACLILYAVPRTSVLGAILLTGYLGGAVATHLRLGSPLLSTTLFPMYVGVLLWGGLVLREDRLRALIPLRR